MGIQVEFNPDLALREFGTPGKKPEQCLPEKLEPGQVYPFLKKGQRLFWLSEDEEWAKGELPLYKTKGDGKFSRPIASIKIIEVTHFIEHKDIWTKGKYKVIEVLTGDKINFEGMKRIK
ncbi:MAG: hypothetical protein ABIH72_05230 [archaeon]